MGEELNESARPSCLGYLHFLIQQNLEAEDSGTHSLPLLGDQVSTTLFSSK